MVKRVIRSQSKKRAKSQSNRRVRSQSNRRARSQSKRRVRSQSKRRVRSQSKRRARSQSKRRKSLKKIRQAGGGFCRDCSIITLFIFLFMVFRITNDMAFIEIMSGGEQSITKIVAGVNIPADIEKMGLSLGAIENRESWENVLEATRRVDENGVSDLDMVLGLNDGNYGYTRPMLPPGQQMVLNQQDPQNTRLLLDTTNDNSVLRRPENYDRLYSERSMDTTLASPITTSPAVTSDLNIILQELMPTIMRMTYPGKDPDKVMPSELYVGGATGSPTPSIFGPTRPHQDRGNTGKAPDLTHVYKVMYYHGDGSDDWTSSPTRFFTDIDGITAKPYERREFNSFQNATEIVGLDNLGYNSSDQIFVIIFDNNKLFHASPKVTGFLDSFGKSPRVLTQLHIAWSDGTSPLIEEYS